MRTSIPGSPSPTASPLSHPNHGRAQLWMRSVCSPLSAGCVWSSDVKADHLSRHIVEHPRHLKRSTEWSLDQGIATVLFDLWVVPMVDLFATRLNNKVETLYSLLPDAVALPGNPLQMDWSQCLLYMYPPQPLLSLALHKMIREEA